MTDEKDLQIIDILLSRLDLGRPFVAPPGTPADRVALLRKAFDKTAADPELRAEAEKIGIRVDPISGIPETLATLHGRGERLAILTSNSEANVEAFLTRHNLPYFEFVSCSSKLFGKGREIRRILRKEKLTPGEILYIGDETRDIEAAKETGLRMAAVTWGYNSEEALQALNPHHLVSLPGELLTLTTK